MGTQDIRSALLPSYDSISCTTVNSAFPIDFILLPHRIVSATHVFLALTTITGVAG